MEIRSTKSESATRMELRGELDIGTAHEVEQAVERCLDEGTREVVLDLTGTTLLDSSGLGALIRAKRTVDARQASMTVHSPHGSEARLVIEMSRMGGALGLQES
jgi:anti-sigma B factor antagonist